MTADVRFSVVIPIWNDSTWLPGAIRSVLGQSHKALELVISDNASDEDLAAVVATFDDPRIRHHRWPDHVGTYENHNRALDLARHDWLVPLGSDDRLRPDALALMAARIGELSKAGIHPSMVVGRSARVDADGNPAERRYYGSQGAKVVAAGLYEGSAWLRLIASPGAPPWNIGSIAFRHQAVVDGGGAFRPEVGLSADNELVLRMGAMGQVAYVERELMDFTVRSDSDGNQRFFHNRSTGARDTPMGAAFRSALPAFEAQGLVGDRERREVRRAVARLYLQRAGQHRILPGGRGWPAAALDVVRAFREWPGLIGSPSSALRAAGALLAPPAIIRRVSSHLSHLGEQPLEVI
ncbi:MAG TPA: glycosyltransferase [Candidatus Limnocylindria bacterium]|jgi:GT2 family glycosyltransferase|nr:glycosyltransferase [Candidatus Limnocylindria bacterium]